MPRRNHREPRRPYEPIDLTPEDVNKPRPIDGEAQYQRERRERAERAKRQRDARINGGIDWTVCLVPGCGEGLYVIGLANHHEPVARDHTAALPMCIYHLGVAAEQAKAETARPVTDTVRLLLEARKQAVAENVLEAHRTRRMERQDGHLYALRANGLIKVGWSREVDRRLRAYGPDVEVLAVWPGTRQDETNLHRQLRPALAAGREWYTDGPITQSFIDEMVSLYGPPEVFTEWTRPKDIIKPRRRAG